MHKRCNKSAQSGTEYCVKHGGKKTSKVEAGDKALETGDDTPLSNDGDDNSNDEDNKGDGIDCANNGLDGIQTCIVKAKRQLRNSDVLIVLVLENMG